LVVPAQHLADAEEALLLADLVSEAPKRRWLARGYVGGRHRTDGATWTAPILKDAATWPPEKQAALLLGFAVGEETWRLAEGFDEETERHYWEEAPACGS
jgi:hypothetical protein